MGASGVALQSYIAASNRYTIHDGAIKAAKVYVVITSAIDCRHRSALPSRNETLRKRLRVRISFGTANPSRLNLYVSSRLSSETGMNTSDDDLPRDKYLG